jgi:ankyrin repeat protein
VRLLLDNGADINSVSYEPEGFTPIMAAAVAGHTETVQLLLDRGADLTIRDCDNTTLLDATMLAGHRDTVQVLLKAIGGPNYPLESIALDIAVADSIEAITSRMLAAGISYATTDREHHQEKSAARISEVLRQGGRLVRPKAFTNMVYVALHEENVEVVHSLSRFFDRRTNTHLPNGDTPLTFAVRRRNTALVEELLDWGHDISIESRCPTDENYTPLLQALVDLDEDCERDTSVVDVLVDSKRCKLMAGKDARSTPFDYVLSHYSRWTNGVALPLLSRMWRSVEHIQDDRSDDGSTLMHSAVWYGRTDLISSLLSKGADINAKDKRGCTPFLLECQSNAKILRILISHGADPHVKDTDGQGALHAAAGAGHVGVITQLLSLNLPLDLHDNNGYTPFSWAVICGQEDAALHLHHKGASIPTNTFRHGRTLLHTAASLCMEKLVPVLYSNGSFNMNAQDDMGFTPLALACRNGSIDLVSALYVRSAEIRIAHYAHDSPPHLTLAAGNDAVAEFLLKRCADAFARGREGDMPLHLAAKHGNPVTTQLLLEMLGANIEALDGMGRTPLCVCAGAFIARILLDHGANINFADSKGWTALHYAVAREDVDTFNVLVGAGASLEARTLDDGLDVYDRIDRLEEGVAGPFKAILRLPY